MYKRNCLTCSHEILTKRKDKRFCSRLCYRRQPEIAQRYSDRTNKYQAKHSREPRRRYQKLIYKCNHEKRKFDLTYDACLNLWKNGCIYCKKDIMNETGCGLDRINNDKGYTFDNVVSCCGDCNKIRNNILTHKEMEVAMTAILNYRRELYA